MGRSCQNFGFSGKKNRTIVSGGIKSLGVFFFFFFFFFGGIWNWNGWMGLGYFIEFKFLWVGLIKIYFRLGFDWVK
ncbi:hypothetical protein HanIR_Chr10g0493911 [Helianthus annuus]|nr:hypothetical protein HanIR_Chr10g0493911 [Helianthus annuus]